MSTVKTLEMTDLRFLESWVNSGPITVSYLRRNELFSKIGVRTSREANNGKLFLCSYITYLIIDCLLCTNIWTNNYGKFILNYADMFRCYYTIFRDFTVMLAKVMNHKMTK